jgi:hypothetical protein
MFAQTASNLRFASREIALEKQMQRGDRQRHHADAALIALVAETIARDRADRMPADDVRVWTEDGTCSGEKAVRIVFRRAVDEREIGGGTGFGQRRVRGVMSRSIRIGLLAVSCAGLRRHPSSRGVRAR